MQSRSFSRVFIFMKRHSLQAHRSVGAGMKCLSGHSFWRRCNIPASVAMMMSLAGVFRHQATIFSVEQTSSASIRTERVHSGWATTGAPGNCWRIRVMA